MIRVVHPTHKIVTFNGNGSVGCQYCGKLAASRSIEKPCVNSGDTTALLGKVTNESIFQFRYPC